MKVVFPFVAQPHQIPHAIPVAAEMALAYPEIEVHVACSTEEQVQMVQRVAAAYDGVQFHIKRLKVSPLARWVSRLLRVSVPAKEVVLWDNRAYLSSFDAIIVPERTSLFLKRIGVRKPKLVWTTHGAGDRAISYAKDISVFDFILLAGNKQEERMLADGLVRPGGYVVGSYPKFDFMHRLGRSGTRLFDNDRPTVVYAPHFRSALSSWPRDGFEVLEFFARSERYNLVFAPHVRLFDPPTERAYQRFDAYRYLPHMIVDLGSLKSIDMTYMLGADIYLGDVSSQVTEFLVRPRPCVFLNSHDVDWRESPDYLFWKNGIVIDSPAELERALEQAQEQQPQLEAVQRDYFRDSFSLDEGVNSARLGADAIVAYLRREQVTA